MIRHCDGTDPNLTREIRESSFTPDTMTCNDSWQFTARTGYIIIQCQCGLTFNDENRLVTYPHQLF